MDNDLTNRHYARQQSLIINARYALSRAEIDIVLTLLTAIHKEDKDFKDYTFTVKDLEAKTERSWNSAQLRDTVKSLMSKPLDIPKEKGWTIINWFSFFDYEDGLITCRFDKKLKPYLLDIKGRWVLSDIRHILPMKSSYSKRIYLMLKEYAKFGVRKFEVVELQDVLKVPKSFMVYSEFKKKVLLRAVADINKFTDLEIELAEKKSGRKVKWITFHIKKNESDLKAFISVVREQYINVPLMITKENETVKCDDKGLLYFNNSTKTIDKDTAQKLWELMHQNRDKFLPFQTPLFDDTAPTIDTTTNKPRAKTKPKREDNRLTLDELSYRNMGDVADLFMTHESDIEHEFRIFKNYQLSKLPPDAKRKWRPLFINWLLQGNKFPTSSIYEDMIQDEDYE